jgi:hypothetical protein
MSPSVLSQLIRHTIHSCKPLSPFQGTKSAVMGDRNSGITERQKKKNAVERANSRSQSVHPTFRGTSLSAECQSTQDLRARHGPCALCNIQLGEDVLRVRLHRLGRDVEASFAPSFVSHETLGVSCGTHDENDALNGFGQKSPRRKRFRIPAVPSLSVAPELVPDAFV